MTTSGSGAVNSSFRIGIVASKFNQFIVDQLVAGARDALTRNGVDASDQVLVWVPGAFELPLMAKEMAMTGQFSAILALGAVIRGGTPHFEFVAGECARGLSQVALDQRIPVIFGVLTTDTIEQALERAGTGEDNKGFDTAVAAIEMVKALRGVYALARQDGRK